MLARPLNSESSLPVDSSMPVNSQGSMPQINFVQKAASERKRLKTWAFFKSGSWSLGSE
jgi:hypothetical protein